MLSKIFNRRSGGRWLILSLCLLLTACGNGASAVKESAQLRWNALIDGDFRTAYQYYTEAFRSAVPMKSFRKQVTGVGLWNQAQVEKVECDQSGKRCAAAIKVTVALKMRGVHKPVESSNVVHETWVKEGLFSDWRYIKN